MRFHISESRTNEGTVQVKRYEIKNFCQFTNREGLYLYFFYPSRLQKFSSKLFKISTLTLFTLRTIYLLDKLPRYCKVAKFPAM
jgi:hypothetical protein